MTKNAYTVEGDFQMGRTRQHFALEIVAKDEKAAREHAYTDLGSRHGVNRRQIAITAVKLLKSDEVESSITRKLLKA